MTEKAWRTMAKLLAGQSRRFHAQLSKPACPKPSTFQLMAFRMGRTSVKQMLAENKRDYVYFRDRGWFESDYYYPTRLGPLKKAVGKFFDWMFGRIYKKREEAPAPQQAALAGASARSAEEHGQ